MVIPDDLDPGLAHDVERAAHDVYGISVNDWVTAVLSLATCQLADDNPYYRELVDNKR